MSNVEELIRTGKATVVDVRTPGEFVNGHAAGSINISLQELPYRLDEFRDMQNIVLCCASGNRSSQAEGFLKANGIECENAGSWMDVVNCLC